MKKQRLFALFWTAVLVQALVIPAYARQMLIPVGRVVGLSLEEGSVTVAAFDDALGQFAREAGLRIGDEILSVNGVVIDSAEDLHEALNRSDGTVEILLCRQGQERRVTMAPAVTADGPRLGVMIREGITGIGTVTWYDPESDTFGALGHGVSDSRGSLCAMRRGDVYAATVSGVRAGRAGAPGQLRGAVEEDDPIAGLTENTPFGVFGSGRRWQGEAMPTAEAGEVTVGPAQIMSNVSGDQVALFDVEIVKFCDQEPSNGRDMMLQVTDPSLLSQTGGIVAGMSGSPIIQDGKLIGAVTHVLVNDPSRGYGIFIENMLEAAG